MSLVLKIYEKDEIYIECSWVKYEPSYKVFVGEKMQGNDLVHQIWSKNYATKEQAINSFKRQVAKVKKH